MPTRRRPAQLPLQRRWCQLPGAGPAATASRRRACLCMSRWLNRRQRCLAAAAWAAAWLPASGGSIRAAWRDSPLAGNRPGSCTSRTRRLWHHQPPRPSSPCCTRSSSCGHQPQRRSSRCHSRRPCGCPCHRTWQHQPPRPSRPCLTRRPCRQASFSSSPYRSRRPCRHRHPPSRRRCRSRRPCHQHQRSSCLLCRSHRLCHRH